MPLALSKELSSHSAAHISCCFRKLNKNQVLSSRARRKKMLCSSFSCAELIFILIHKRPEADLLPRRPRSEHRICAALEMWMLFLRESMQKRKCIAEAKPALRNIPSIPQPSQASGRREREKEQIHFTLPLSKHPCTYSCPQHPPRSRPLLQNCSRRGTSEKLRQAYANKAAIKLSRRKILIQEAPTFRSLFFTNKPIG